MTFQSTVRTELPLGVIGEFAFDGPNRTKSYTLDTTSADNNVIGRAFTVDSEGVAAAGGDAGVFAGIMVNPKAYAVDTLFNNADGELALANGQVAELCTMGEIIVKVPPSAAIGDGVFYKDATGIIGTGTASTGETQIPNATVTSFTATGAGLAVVTLTN
jgi:hypothetical protein